jgi:hypothetical protein
MSSSFQNGDEFALGFTKGFSEQIFLTTVLYEDQSQNQRRLEARGSLPTIATKARQPV